MGIKLRGRYMIYRTNALGLNFSKGLRRIFPSFCMGSLPERISRPSPTTAVAFLERRVPSKVSRSASWSNHPRATVLMIAELSLRIRSTVVKTASGPLTKTSTASCGRYVNANMLPMTPTESVMYGPSLERNGFHSDR